MNEKIIIWRVLCISVLNQLELIEFLKYAKFNVWNEEALL